jgi:GDP-L-fucose synthase
LLLSPISGGIVHDLSKPDGTLRKLMSAAKLRGLGWSPAIALRDGIADAYQAFLAGNYSERMQEDAA